MAQSKGKILVAPNIKRFDFETEEHGLSAHIVPVSFGSEIIKYFQRLSFVL